MGLFTILQAINLSTIRNEMDYIRSLFYAHSMQNRFLLNLEFLVTQIKLISDDEPILVLECNSIREVGDFSSLFVLLKVEIVLKGSLDFIPSPSTSVKIQIVDEKVCLRCKSK